MADWSSPTKVELFLGALCEQEELPRAFVSDARRLLGLPYESRELDASGQVVIRRPRVDAALVEHMRVSLNDAGYTVKIQARSYQIERTSD